MSQQILAQFEASQLRSDLPAIKAGMTVKVYQKLKEGEKERVQIFEGIVIKVSSGTGIGKAFTVRKIMDGIGVEKVYPIHSPTIEKVEIVKKAKVRRAKLYYLRGKTGKAAKLYEEREKVAA